MRGRKRTIGAALLLSVALILATAGTALMAVQTQELCKAGPASIVITYDDVSPFLVHTWQLIDLGGAPGTMTATFNLPSFGPVSANIASNGGNGAVNDISGLNLQMVAGVKKYPTSAVPLVPPIQPTCSWSSA